MLSIKRFLYRVAIRFLIITISIVATDAYASNKEDSLTAAYVYYFARFTTWQDNDDKTNINVCIISENIDLIAEFKSVSKKSQASNTPLKILHISNKAAFENLTQCHILYNEDQNQLTNKNIKKNVLKNTLIVTKTENKQHRGTINFLLTGTKLGFEIDRKKASNANLKISSKLLSLATKVF